ncbi:MAG: hypothetical protein RQ756_01685, partial [Flavobacteriaceae bacterium]|nr:hypothetical protein [Flavobacteriaceae bacterium]
MRLFLLLCFCCGFAGFAQSGKTKRIKVAAKDSIPIDSVSINPAFFKIFDRTGKVLDSTQYTVDFKTARLILSPEVKQDSLWIEFLPYPDFLTKKYTNLDPKIVIADPSAENLYYQIKSQQPQTDESLFDGLNASGSITRGLVVGNNQNSSVRSELDLQISGKLSEKVSIRASIQDANVPSQQGGFTQRLDEFDEVFIELFSDQWAVRAGDIDLINDYSYFSPFSKRVQGISTRIHFEGNASTTQVHASGALVRGVFARSVFTASEGNQGPYKLTGPNGELFILIVSGSETVYVNGAPLQRGENLDYVIDYNAGEITFNPTFPITSEMRIVVDYQFSERNFTRVIAYGGANYESENFKLKVFGYNENDLKNQPLQQNLNQEQAQILSEAGDDTSLMSAPSAIPAEFSENRILYRKITIGTQEVFEFSNDPSETLFEVRFSFVGANQGNYVPTNTNAISTIFEFVPPINGIPQGSFEPIVRLFAPEKLQLVGLQSEITPGEKTAIFVEGVLSNNDLNLFSSLDDADNDGQAGRVAVNHQLIKNETQQLTISGEIDYVADKFRTIEVLYEPEFNRNWGLLNRNGDQRLVHTGLQWSGNNENQIAYRFSNLNFSKGYNGTRNELSGSNRYKKWIATYNVSLLTADEGVRDFNFIRYNADFRYAPENYWAGVRLSGEDVEEENTETNTLAEVSQGFNSVEVFSGIGKKNKTFLEIGGIFRQNDSLRNNRVQRVNTSETFYVRSTAVKSKTADLSLFGSFRTLNFSDDRPKEQSLNSRITYQQRMLNNLFTINTLYETNSGTIAQQNFTFVEVEPGQGDFTWIDYNENGIQELNEFEEALFPDEATFIRVLLPNQRFVNTHQNKFSQTLSVNFAQLKEDESSFRTLVRKFFNQTAYIIDRKYLREGSNFRFNPFSVGDEQQLGLNESFRNSLFFNRGKQRYT